ncbi:FecR domain-containing protein [Rubrivivax gelatinosus]|uniref:Putative transmembrane sensor FecR n=1 Tax=Rubrivivax gelatinosus (strain NBRC 100245 / IL144) TaxID=983917 RepID=I0HTQ1_RUBGI|nr:FecR domain-containing protein [Rubrivivax gelatinosus]BAL96388.1 putative transmembrane sensor FecR [Rubrivivax gelatinosus IL144]
MDAAEAPIPPAVARRAVAWWVDLQSEDADEALRRRWQRWLARDEVHRRAWARLEAVGARLNGRVHQGLAGVPGASALVQVALAEAAPSRRRALGAALLAVLAGGAAWELHGDPAVQARLADLGTGVGERRRLVLADGTRLALNSGSAVDLRYGTTERRLVLRRGEILVETAPDPARRPFVVQTGAGELRPLGTRFRVRDRGDQFELAVHEGAVELRPATGAARVLAAGEQARFDAAGVGPRQAADADAAAWVDGMLVASGLRLDEFLAELGRHRRGRLDCAPEVAALRVSGSYPLADVDRVLATLPAVLPVRAVWRTRWWLTLHAKT